MLHKCYVSTNCDRVGPNVTRFSNPQKCQIDFKKPRNQQEILQPKTAHFLNAFSCFLLGSKCNLYHFGSFLKKLPFFYKRIFSPKKAPRIMFLVSHRKLWLLRVCISEITSRLTIFCTMLHNVSSLSLPHALDYPSSFP